MKESYIEGKAPTKHTLGENEIEYNYVDEKMFTIDKNGNRRVVNGLTFEDDWTQKKYYKDSVVIHNTGVYVSLIDTIEEPDAGSEWRRIGNTITPIVVSGWSGTFRIPQNKMVTVENGLITDVS